MGDRRCCCGCEIAEDDFDRPDANELGDNWPLTLGSATWQIGDWHIEDGCAVCQDTDGVALHRTQHKVPDESMVVEMTLLGNLSVTQDSECIYRVVLNAVDAENYHCVDYLVRNNPAPGEEDELILGKVTGGSYAELKRDTVEGPTGDCVVWGRIGGGVFCGGIYGAVFSYVGTDESVISGGYWAGIGVKNASEELKIDAWLFEEHFETNEDCKWCGCRCEDNLLADTLYAVLNGDPGGRMAGLVDCEVEMPWERENLQWAGSETCCNEDFNLILNCGDPPDYSVDSFTLLIQGCTDSDPRNVGGWVELSPNEGSTCDPLNLIFGPVTVSASDLGCTCGNPLEDPGSYMIVITE